MKETSFALIYALVEECKKSGTCHELMSFGKADGSSVLYYSLMVNGDSYFVKIVKAYLDKSSTILKRDDCKAFTFDNAKFFATDFNDALSTVYIH